MSSLKELLAQREALEQKIADLRKSETSEAIEKIRSMIDDYSLTPEQLFPSSFRSKTPKTKTATATNKVAAKYRDPDTGKEWSGRGLAPKWLLGKDKSDYLIA